MIFMVVLKNDENDDGFVVCINIDIILLAIMLSTIFFNRNIFERVIHLNLSSKKMKFLFKRYLAFEHEHGNEMSIEKVKTKAMEYVESKVALS